jgi:hypothetical protein
MGGIGGVLAGNCLDRIPGAARGASARRTIQDWILSPFSFHRNSNCPLAALLQQFDSKNAVFLGKNRYTAVG